MRATHEYHKLLQYIIDNGKKKNDRTSTGTTSIFDYKIKFDMSQGFPLITTKRLHLRSIIHELLWFLKGSTNTKYLQENGVTIWDEWADENGDLGPVYGKQWADWGGQPGYLETKTITDTNGSMSWPERVGKSNGINQIQNAIDTLKNNPDSRRIMVSAWNVGEIDKMALPPCHWAFELYTEELTEAEIHKYVMDTHNIEPEKVKYYMRGYVGPKRRLSLKWHQRSVDTFLGLPFNIASYALLLHMFAQQTNMVPGTLVGDLTNVHIYDNHMEYVEKQLERDAFKHATPTLKLNKVFHTEAPWGGNLVNSIDTIFDYTFEDFTIENYEYFPNWKNVPIAI